jgi:hypothetical protein
MDMSPDPKNYSYKVQEGWWKLPASWKLGTVSAVACDSKDRVFAFTRSDNPLVVFDREGNYMETWGKGIINTAHGLFIDKDDNVFCADRGSHCIYKFNPAGKLIMTLGTPGVIGKDGNPFNIPTDMCVAPDGSIYVSDGYGNRRIHKYSSDGKLLLSWGEQGTGQGQFVLPHSVRVDKYNRVWVCDRDHYRIQIFDDNGKFIKEWPGLKLPDTVFFDKTEDVVYISELDYQVSIYTFDGKLITQWGGGKTSGKPGEFFGWPHGIWLDSHMDMYVCEVNSEERLQKFIRQ